MIYLQKILFQTITNLEQKKVKIGLIMKSVTIPYKNRHILKKKVPTFLYTYQKLLVTFKQK